MDIKGERGLWSAVIKLAIEDAEEIIIRMKNDLGIYQCTSVRVDLELKSLYREIKTDWFKAICLWVDVDHRKVLQFVWSCEERHRVVTRLVVQTEEFDRIKDLKEFPNRRRGL